VLRRSGVISGVEVAIRPHSRPWGVLGAYSTTQRQFSADEVDFVCVVADMLALAIDCAGIEGRTREQIAQLLHDEALQSLYTARQYLASAAGEDVGRDWVIRARDGVHRAIRELRAVVSDLHPVAVEAVQWREAMEAAVRQHSRRSGFAATVDLELEPGDGWAPLLLSLTGELTANVAEHAQARHVRVRLRRLGQGLALEVSDDGSGIAPGRVEEALAEGHIGLASAARRVRALGGTLTIDSTPGEGTRVRIELPRPGWPDQARGGAESGAE
jgi:two-component system NarL family sensor kinase